MESTARARVALVNSERIAADRTQIPARTAVQPVMKREMRPRDCPEATGLRLRVELFALKYRAAGMRERLKLRSTTRPEIELGIRTVTWDDARGM